MAMIVINFQYFYIIIELMYNEETTNFVNFPKDVISILIIDLYLIFQR